MKPDNTPENVKKLRLKAGLTQKECSHIYGVGLRTWQKKEEVNTQNSQSLSLVEFEFLCYLQENILNTCSAKGSQNKMTCDGFILVPGVAPVAR